MNAVSTMPAFFGDSDHYIPTSTASYSPLPSITYNSPVSEESSPLSRFEKDELHEHIEKLRELRSGWDGEDALPISREALERSHQLIESLTSPIGAPEIRATTNGTVEFFWNHNQGEAILEIGRTTYSFVCDRGARPPLLFDGNVAAGDVAPSIVQLLSVGFGIATTHSITQAT